ncbi:hypothetical protein [Saccharopolyspora sp. 5N708]|uniref:hypothetical protein n=1 Tax=Saccharopolyspora sp. 5N708 TaxID=3457424 RepID=UPI003FD22721
MDARTVLLAAPRSRRNPIWYWWSARPSPPAGRRTGRLGSARNAMNSVVIRPQLTDVLVTGVLALILKAVDARLPVLPLRRGIHRDSAPAERI